MKKIMLITIIGILLITLISAVVVNINKNLNFTPAQATALDSLGLRTYSVIDYDIGDEIERCLKREEAINSCRKFKTYYLNCFEYDEDEIECLTLEKIYYTNQEMLDILDNWEEERIRVIADVKLSRESRTKEVIREGETTSK